MAWPEAPGERIRHSSDKAKISVVHIGLPRSDILRDVRVFRALQIPVRPELESMCVGVKLPDVRTYSGYVTEVSLWRCTGLLTISH